MNRLSRRDFLKLLGVATAATAIPLGVGGASATAESADDDTVVENVTFEINECPVAFHSMQITVSYPTEHLRSFDGTTRYIPLQPQTKVKFETTDFETVCKATFKGHGLNRLTWRLQYGKNVLTGNYQSIQSYSGIDGTFSHDMSGVGIVQAELFTA